MPTVVSEGILCHLPPTAEGALQRFWPTFDASKGSGLVVCQVSIEGFTVAETTQGVEHDAPTDDGAHSSDHG